MKLTCLKGKKAGESLDFNPPGVFIGREVDNDLQILEDGISQYHAKILFDDGKWVLYDLNSINGTKVNGERIDQPTVLTSKDIIYFYNVAYRIEFQSEEEKTGTAKIKDDGSDDCIRIRSPEESKPSPKTENDNQNEINEKTTYEKANQKSKEGKTPLKTQKEIAEAVVMKRLVAQAVQEKKKRLRFIMFFITIIVNAIILIWWLNYKGYINLHELYESLFSDEGFISSLK